MLFDYRAFWLAKDPRHADEYQDAYAVDPARGLAAIADGVSASLFAARWADVLARAAVDEPPDVQDSACLDKWLAGCRTQWSRPIEPDTLPWHQRLKLHDGASSTLLWIRLAEVDLASRSRIQRDRQLDRTFRLEAMPSVTAACSTCGTTGLAVRFRSAAVTNLAPIRRPLAAPAAIRTSGNCSSRSTSSAAVATY